MTSEIYFDNAASTKPYDEVIIRMTEVLKYNYGNSLSVHKKGLEANKIIKSATETLADILKCNTNEIIFTSGGTEANNLAIKGTYYANKGRGHHIITSLYEHASVMSTFNDLKNDGADISYIKISNDGVANIDNLSNLLTEKSIFVSLMKVNNEVGTINNIELASKIVKEKNSNIIFHTDNVQGFCKLPVNLNKLKNIDLMSLSGHKFNGPKGVGALFVRKGTNILPMINGNLYPNHLRAGTLNTAAIAGLEIAAMISNKNMEANFKKVSKLNKYLEENITKEIDDIKILGDKNKVPYITDIAFRNIKSEVLLNHLSAIDIYLSSGSACSSKKQTYSHVLTAMDISKEYIDGVIRISLSHDNTFEEIDRLIKEIKLILPMLRMIRRK